jgi:hypothetical protein
LSSFSGKDVTAAFAAIEVVDVDVDAVEARSVFHLLCTPAWLEGRQWKELAW